MAVVNITYEFTITNDAKLAIFVGATCAITARGGGVPTINIDIDDSVDDPDELDEYMLELGFTRVVG